MPHAKQVLLTACSRILKPLVRILLRNSVTYPEFARVAQRAFLKAAASDGASGIEQLSVTTGIPESEAALALSDRPASEDGSQLAGITRLLAAWHTDSDFTGPYGLPLELCVEPIPGTKSFADLADRHFPDAPQTELLRHLVASGAVKEMDGWLRVMTRTYLPRVDAPEGLERLGQAVQFFVETIDHNRQQSAPAQKLFERTVYADDGIRPEDLGRFQNYVRERAQLLTEEVDNWLSQLEKPDAKSGERVINTGLGIYHYVEHPHRDD